MPLLTTGAGAFPAASGGSGLVLDGITTGIKYAMSTRKLRTAYAGFSMRVERSADNATLDVGFVSNELDISAINAFVVPGTVGRVVTWYDQSGNGNDHVAPSFSDAPIIILSGTSGIPQINGKSALQLGSGVSAGSSLQNASITGNPVNTLYVNAVIISGGAGSFASASNGGGFEVRLDGGPAEMEVLESFTASLFTSSASLTSSGSIVEFQYEPVGGAYNFWVDRAGAGSGTHSATFAAGTSLIGIEPLSANLGETIAYDLAGGIPSGSQTTIRNNQSAYWGTP